MKFLNDSRPWATIIIGALTLIVAGVGGGIVLWGKPGALSFHQYLDELQRFAIAVGILGIGRGIVAHGKQTAQASQTTDAAMLSSLADDGSGGVTQRVVASPAAVGDVSVPGGGDGAAAPAAPAGPGTAPAQFS